ncbi:hypothetical protein Trydic_g21422 [Trypoxylus dichotomus]
MLHLNRQDVLACVPLRRRLSSGLRFTTLPAGLSHSTINSVPYRTDRSDIAPKGTLSCTGDPFWALLGQNRSPPQLHGVAMGCPLSPVVANLFMEQFESLAIETAVDKPTVWWRYVDDTFVIWPHGRDKLDRFLEHLNGVHPNIQFAMELGHNDELPFLDVRINRDQARTTTSVFRKPTHTDRYLQNQSNHHPDQKNTVVCALVQRGRRVCSEEQLKEELNHLKQALRCNGYPEDVIKRAITSKSRSRDNNDRKIETLGKAYLPKEQINEGRITVSILNNSRINNIKGRRETRGYNNTGRQSKTFFFHMGEHAFSE